MENQLANLDRGYEKLKKEMSRSGDEWHREIDIIISKIKTEIDEIKMKHKDILQKHLNEIKQIQSLIKQTLLALKEIEKSTEVSPTIEYTSNDGLFSKLPAKICVTMPTFTPKSIDRTKLYRMFGDITPLSTVKQEYVFSPNQSNTSVRELLDEPKTVATIHTGYTYLCSVTCENEDRIWTSGETSGIKCFNAEGSLLQTIKTISDNCPTDIAVDSNGDILYSDKYIGRVYKVKNGNSEELIGTHGRVSGNFCVSYSGDLIVSMTSVDETQSKVIRYSGSAEKQTI